MKTKERVTIIMENALICGVGILILVLVLVRLPGQRPPEELKRAKATGRKPRRKKASKPVANDVAPSAVEVEASSTEVVDATPASVDPPHVREEEEESKQLAQDHAANVPSLDDCVVYRKDGLKAASTNEKRRPPLRSAEKARPVVEREEDIFDVVQSESDWKRAAPKPRRPPRVEKETKKEKKASPSAASEKNRRKRERQKQKEQVVREIMRKQL